MTIRDRQVSIGKRQIHRMRLPIVQFALHAKQVVTKVLPTTQSGPRRDWHRTEAHVQRDVAPMNIKNATGSLPESLLLTRLERQVLTEWVRTHCLSDVERMSDLTVVDLDALSARFSLIAKVLCALETNDLEMYVDDLDVVRFLKDQAVAASHLIAEEGHRDAAAGDVRVWNALERKFAFDRRWLLGDAEASYQAAMRAAA